MTGLAGCGGDEDTASDTTGTTEQPSTQGAVPPHDHSESGQGGDSLAPTALSVTESRRAASYVVYRRDGAVRALDGTTGTEAFSDTDAATVIQQAINDLDHGTIRLAAGEYRISEGGIHLASGIRLVGEGRGATVLKLADGVNGRRGDGGSSIINVGGGTSDVTIADMELDGNESNNRDVPPYPMSPQTHGIYIHGSGPRVPEDRKPSNVVVRNVSVHDTIRSNIVLAGRECVLEDVWLANSATDHWLYMAGASHCTVRGLHASGFARAEGIVLGVGQRHCFGNTLSDVTISDISETPYANDEPSGLGGRYPVRSIIFRPPRPDGSQDNTLRDVDIRLPDAPVGQTISVHQPNTRVRGLTYRGPAGTGGIVHFGRRARGSALREASFDVGDAEGIDGQPVVGIAADSATAAQVVIEDDRTTANPAVRVVTPEEPISGVTLRDVAVTASGAALDVRTGAEITELFVENYRDRDDGGVVVDGDVSFSRRGVY